MHTDLLQVPFGVVGTLGNIIIGLALSYTKSKRLYLIAFVVLIPLIGEVVQVCGRQGYRPLRADHVDSTLFRLATVASR